MIKAIVYTSNTGYTGEYAKLLGEETRLPVYSLSDARKSLETGSEIIYLGWLMAGTVKGYPKAAKLFRVSAVCGAAAVPSASFWPHPKSSAMHTAMPNTVMIFFFIFLSSFLHFLFHR